MEKFGFSKDQVSYYLHTYHIDRFKRGSLTIINRKDFDRIISERMNGNLSIADINSKIEYSVDTNFLHIVVDEFLIHSAHTSMGAKVVEFLD